MTLIREAAPDRLDFTLPGTWRTIVVNGGPTKTKRAVHDLVESAVGRADDRATLRAELREQLGAAAQQAAAAGAQQIHFAAELFGLPFPVALTVTWPAFSVRSVAAGTSAERAARVAELIGDRCDHVIVDDPRLGIVRLVRHRDWVASDASTEARVPTIAAEYWVGMPDTGRIVVFSFSSSLIQLEEPLLELFDAITSTLRLPPIATPAADAS